MKKVLLCVVVAAVVIGAAAAVDYYRAGQVIARNERVGEAMDAARAAGERAVETLRVEWALKQDLEELRKNYEAELDRRLNLKSVMGERAYEEIKAKVKAERMEENQLKELREINAKLPR